MKRTTFLLGLFLSMTTIGMKGQHQVVKLDKTTTTVQQLISTIEKQTNLSIDYGQNALDLTKQVKVNSKTEKLSALLDAMIKETDLEYTISGRHVIITKNTPQKPKQTGRKQTIKGQVQDVNGNPLIGVTVKVRGTNNAVVTDLDGNYTISANRGDILECSYVGFTTKDARVNGNQLNLTLHENSKELNEVVVIGYGVQKKTDLTGAVANIRTDKLNTQSNSSIIQALQGKIAGVDIVSLGGTPGSGTRVMIRGIGTLNNSSPLYIVDGMYMNGIDHINPNDIASIDVLKDASSAAIYGSRAANGVVIITTKEGSNTEGKPIIDASMNIGISTPTKLLKMLDAQGWANVTNVSRKAAGMSPLEMALDLENKPNNNWQKIMFGSALIQNYNLSVKGGRNNSSYYNSIGYTNQEGTLKGTGYQRYTLQSKQDFKINIFNIGTNIILSYDQNKPLVYKARGNMIGHILQSIPTLEKFDSNRVGGYGPLYGDVVNLFHPLTMVDDNLMSRLNENTKVYANLYLSIEPLKNLKYKINFTPDFQFSRNKNYMGVFDCGITTHGITELQEYRTQTKSFLVEHLITYNKNIKNHKVSLLAGYSFQDTHYHYLAGEGQGMPTGIKEIDAAAKGIAAAGNSSRSILTSLLGRVFYSYYNRYLLTATIRRDGSSKFSKHHRFGNFPSISIGWNIADEPFFRNWTENIAQLKLRAGYGVLGNQEIPNYQYVSLVSTGINYPDGRGGLIQGAFPKLFANPDIKWEETAMTNVGIDLIALNNQLSITADWYIKNTKDILLTVPIPISTGSANDPIRNAGHIYNSGIELNIGWNKQVNKDFSYQLNLIGTYNKNIVKEMGDEAQTITGGTNFRGVFTTKTLSGYPIGGFWLIKTDGYFNSHEDIQNYQMNGNLIQPSAEPGDIKFRDANKDGNINDKDREYCGSPFPKFTYALNANLVYKNIDISFGLQGVCGNKIYNATRLELEDVTRGVNYLASCSDYWTPEHHNATHPRLIWTDPNRNLRAESDRCLESGTYLRLRTLQIGYNLPTAWFQNICKKARVYINIDNLFTITPYSGYSPDVNLSNVYSRGFDNFIYPTNKTFMLGLNITF